MSTCSRCSRPAGLTLIEVVAAIAIVGTILVGVVLAKARHTRQIARTAQRRQAVRAADRLIAAWWVRESGVPIGQAGPLDADAGLHWQTRLVDSDPIGELGARVVRVEILSLRPAADAQTEPIRETLFAVDLVVPDPEADRQAEQQPEGDGS